MGDNDKLKRKRNGDDDVESAGHNEQEDKKTKKDVSIKELMKQLKERDRKIEEILKEKEEEKKNIP